MAEDNIQRTLDDLIGRFEQGLMLASDKQHILGMLRSLAAMRHELPNIDDIVQRLTDHGLYTKQERNALFIEARDEIVARRNFIWVMQRSSARFISEDDPRSLEYPEAAVVCAELYQIIGCLADELGIFAHPEVQRALDNAGAHRLVHRNLLPWPRQPVRPAGAIPERAHPQIAAMSARAESVGQFEEAVAGAIDWKMEAERANRLLALAEAQVESWREQASQKDAELTVLRDQIERQG